MQLALSRRRIATAWARQLLRRARGEPMVWFALLGAALFWLTAALDWRRETLIRIDAADIAQLRAYWEVQARRSPTEEELAGLIQDRANEEVLYREALRLGLDRDDIVVRRRLAQKLAFLNEDLTPIAPREAELRAFYEQTRFRYAAPDTFTFEQIYFSPERRGAGVEAAARSALEQIEAAGAASPGLGDPFMLQQTNVDAAVGELARDYGEAFAAALPTAPVGVWSGPLESAHGLHLVRVVSRRSAAAPPYQSVAARVREDYIAERRRAANAAWVRGLRSRYRIEIAPTPAAP